ncbi:MAG: S-methyl-5-thioribose-1-phosphate isomerase [Candidatus Melainabacteria bacterium]
MITQSTPVNSLATSGIRPVQLTPEGAVLLDQTLLPNRVVYRTLTTAAEMADAIRTMIVRGAPAIGLAGAFGLVLSLRQTLASAAFAPHDLETIWVRLQEDAHLLKSTRPTAVNLAWAVDTLLEEFRQLALSFQDPGVLMAMMSAKARQLHDEDLAACQAMGALGADVILPLLPGNGAGILTHCNAGALATAGYGTALGVIRSLHQHRPGLQVFADETRPRLQGARLTTWELSQDGIPVTLITDSMSGPLMRDGRVHAVVVGADRIAANGDVANKIGTYNLALVARAHQVPFFVAAPRSTLDLSLANGEGIPIEERDASEIYRLEDKPGSERVCAEGIGFYNPAFDVTPASLITAIITEAGVVSAPYEPGLASLF